MNQVSADLPSVSVVIPTRARPQLLRKCLESLRIQDYPHNRYEMIVVEDGTEAGEAVIAQMTATGAPIRYFRIPHGGHAAAYHQGLSQARCEIVAFIDDDAIAAPNWLREMAGVLTARRGENVIGVGGRVSTDYPDEELKARVSKNGEMIWTGSNVVVPGLQDVDFLPGANMAFWRSALLEIGGFDAGFSRQISWRHETDVCVRLRGRGFRLLYDSKLVVSHYAARWYDPTERLRPAVVWNMVRDDAYFRTKNFGLKGVAGALASNARGVKTRLTLGSITLFLALIHLVAWIPGAWRGLTKKDRQVGILRSR